MAAKGWSKSFHDPIPQTRGRQLVTFKDAADYITRLPRAERWPVAIAALLLVAEHNGRPMLARIGLMWAQNGLSSACSTPTVRNIIGDGES
jgi:hypothetical protein